jgi:hypothetical protein
LMESRTDVRSVFWRAADSRRLFTGTREELEA